MAEESKGNQEELIIQQKVYDMIMYAYPAVEQFPKSQKFSLAQDMKKMPGQYHAVCHSGK